MKTRIVSFLFAAAFATTLPAAVTINVANNAPNGIASGGTGTGTGLLSTSVGNIATNRGIPVTTYTVSNVNLTSVGGTSTESFTFTVTYSQTGGTGVQFSGFGNVSVTGNSNNDNVNLAETLTATIALATTSFTNLSLVGFTSARAGGFGAGETGTFTWSGGSFNINGTNGTVANSVTGNSFTLSVGSGTALSLEGFGARFEAVPEPSTALLGGLGALALLRRRRSA